MAEIKPSYTKPRILLIDLPVSATEALESLGLNAQSGTFGPRYKVPISEEAWLVESDSSLPGYTEQEIVVLDTSPTDLLPYPNPRRTWVDTVPHILGHCGHGVIDTRPLAMLQASELTKRILETGGLFVEFASRQYEVEYLWNRDGRRRAYENLSLRNDPFIGKLDFVPAADQGVEFQEVGDLAIHPHLRRFLRGSVFESTFQKKWHPANEYPFFIPILQSKYGETVAFYYAANEKGGKILVLPQIEDKAGLLVELFKNYLPVVHARLFPEHEGDRWVHREEYEHPAILDRQARQNEIQRRADEEKAAIDEEIGAERARLEFLHGLLTKSGDELVADVKSALEFIGFERVVDVDVAEKDQPNKQEDLQILDRPTKVLVEVKGLGGVPREANTQQVIKFMLRRFRNWIWHGEPVLPPHGLTLVNHQRGMPPLDRDHTNVFTRAQIDDAIENETGLMTTWDLFRLIRGTERWGWDRRRVKDVFYGKGRVGELPPHYRELGKVARFLDKLGVVSVEVGEGMVLKDGDVVGYDLRDRFHEETVRGLQVEKTEVGEALAGQKGAFVSTLAASELKEGTVVYMAREAD